jgi:hypothetical protein
MPSPSDPALYNEAKDFIMSKYKTNSPFASGAVVKHYKQLYKKKHNSTDSYTQDDKPKNLKRWFDEKWVSANPSAGISDADAYQVFRPTKKVNDKTPKLLQDIPVNILRKNISLKQNFKAKKRLPKFVKIIHHAILGGKLSTSDFSGLLNASYDKKQKKVGNFEQDRDLSTNTSKVYRDPTTGQTVVAHKGTTGFSDWYNNAVYAIGGDTLYKTTSRYKEAKKVQKDAEKKYGRENITTIGHSQGGKQAELLGRKGNEIITLNKATRPFSNTKQANQTDIRTSGDLVSAFNPFQPKSDITIPSKTYNPLIEHSIDTVDRLNPNKIIGGMIVQRFS